MFDIRWILWGVPGNGTDGSRTCKNQNILVVLSELVTSDQSPVWPGGSPADNGGGHGEPPVNTEETHTEPDSRGPEEMLEHSPGLVQGSARQYQASWG